MLKAFQESRSLKKKKILVRTIPFKAKEDGGILVAWMEQKMFLQGFHEHSSMT